MFYNEKEWPHNHNVYASTTTATTNFTFPVSSLGWHPGAVSGFVEGGLVDEAGGSVRLSCSPASEAACYRGVGRSVLSQLHLITCPVVILVGEQSAHLDRQGSSTIDHFRRIGALFPNCRVSLIKGTGHFHPQENPASVASEINDAVGHLQSRPDLPTSKL